MIIVDPKSKEQIQEVLSTTDIYRITEMPVSTISAESPGDSSTKLRYNWIYNKEGIFFLEQYKDVYSRIFELMTHRDTPHSLRQKVNIVHTLLECNMETDVPVHISLAPKTTKKELTLNDINFFDHKVIIHPGYTRGQGSLFLNKPLKNVLLYIKKSHGIKVHKSKNIVKINNEEELLKNYNSRYLNSKESYWFDFIMGRPSHDILNGLKYHIGTDTRILKLTRMIRSNKDKVANDHPSHYYMFENWRSFNLFCNTLFKDKFKIFCEEPQTLSIKFKENEKNFTKELFGDGVEKSLSNLLSSNLNYQGFGRPPVPPHDSGLLGEEFKLYEKFYDLGLKRTVPYTDNGLNVQEALIENTLTSDFFELAKKNNYKGIVMYINKDIISKINRLFLEFLFLLPCNNAVSRLKTNKLALINCSHEYWKNKTNYKEVIIPETFLSYEI